MKKKRNLRVSFVKKAKIIIIPCIDDFIELLPLLHCSRIEMLEIKLDAYEELEVYRHSDICKQKKLDSMIALLCHETDGHTSILTPSKLCFASGVDPNDPYVDITMREAAVLLYQPSLSDKGTVPLADIIVREAAVLLYQPSLSDKGTVPLVDIIVDAAVFIKVLV